MVDLVTGVGGFIGSQLARALVAEGRQVRGFVRESLPPDDLVRAGLQVFRGDVTDPTSISRAVAGVDRVFHCAALVSDWGERADFRTANERGVASLLSAAATAGVGRLIHLSTTDVYGFPDAPVDERAPFRSRGWPYGDTKIAGEKLVWEFARESELPVTVIRPANVYGVGSLSFVGEIASLLRRAKMVHLGRATPPAGLCHVENLVDCILLAADNEKAVGQAYNVSDGSDVSWRTFTDTLADALELDRPEITLPRPLAYATAWCLEKNYAHRHVRHRPMLTRMAVEILTSDQSFSIGKARRDLGYEPRHTFHGSLPDMVSWLQGRRPC